MVQIPRLPAVFIHRTEGLVDSFSQGLEKSYSVNSSILRGIEPWLKNFHQLLLHPPKVNGRERLLGILRTYDDVIYRIRQSMELSVL